MSATGAIWVVVEHEDGVERSVAHELLSHGRKIADGVGCELHAILLGQGTGRIADRIEGHPDRIVALEGLGLARYSSDGYVRVLHELVRQRNPMILMTGSGLRGMEFMPRLAARLGVSMVSEVTGLEVSEGGGLRVRKPVHGGRFFVDMEPGGQPPYLLAVRPRAFHRTAGQRKAERETIEIHLADGDVRTSVVERLPKVEGAVDLTEARIVVAGGRGMKGAEKFSLIEELAASLGGAVGASRAVVDSKWRPAGEQVGKSGKTVSPELYLAIGISGAIHHIMGMDTSKLVVALNSDPKALIFQHADLGIVDDLFQVVPALIEELKNAK